MAVPQTSPAKLGAMLKAFPDCGLHCLLEAINTQSDCSLSDPACACTSKAVQVTASVCVQHSCTIPDALTTQNLTNVLCGVSSHHDRAYIAIAYSFVIIASILIALRFITRLTKRNPLWWDDYFALISALVAIGFTVVCGIIDRLGVGLDTWAVPLENLSPILTLLWVALMCYAISRCFVRVSISLFLMRIFRVSGARPLIILTLVLNVAITLTFMLCVIFQCTPVSYFWNGWDGLHDGHCIDQWVMFLAGGCISTSLDIFLILLPFRWIFQLQLSRAKKITTTAMFSLGVIVIVTSIMRLVALHTFTHSDNVTRNLTKLVIWGGLELYVALICACLPSLRPLLKLAMSRVRLWATSVAKSGGSSSSGPSDYRIYSGGKNKLPSDDGHDLQQIEVGNATQRPPKILLTTTIQQQRKSPETESQMNLTMTTINDIELYGRQQGNSW